MKSEVTMVITSCGRYDLLRRTFTSFFKFNTYPLNEIIIIEDGNLGDLPKDLRSNPRLSFMSTGHRIGQIRAIDKAYRQVETEYIFHCEDDWEFYAPAFIEKSLAVLSSNSKILQVWLRAFNDTNGRHPEIKYSYFTDDVEYKILKELYTESGIWYGFSFNPGLKRFTEYQLLGSYKSLDPYDMFDSGQLENIISKYYYDQGYVAAILADNSGNGFCKHIGPDNRLRKSLLNSPD